ncbi:MAG: hypothetical protein LBH56_01725 [Coriobacteriales bacterium]|jgi:hypothetical protein|nr:hypothetical protein [Coriobacteriales bacterium]
MLKIPTKMLLLAAAFVWLAAGFSVVSVGVTAAEVSWTAPMALASLAVYVLFLVMFLMITRRHIRRIRGYTEELTNMFKFFDAKSYVLIAVMIVLGAAVRLSGLVPGFIIAPFYSGLGLALLTAAVYYVVTYVAICDELVVKH